MLIDATHPEETRVVVVSGNRLEEFDYESSRKKQIKGNIYLAKVTRVEPSLQAAFVEYGGNRHGFLAFNEIHPDYYKIPVADREALNREIEAAMADAHHHPEPAPRIDTYSGEGDDAAPHDAEHDAPREAAPAETLLDDRSAAPGDEAAPPADAAGGPSAPASDAPAEAQPASAEPPPIPPEAEDMLPEDGASDSGPAADGDVESAPAAETVEEFAGDDLEEIRRRHHRIWQRKYRIQEVIRKRQVLLIQVTKEERGTKGAALTTYISLAGRYCVLMPNTPRGGGISRKITSQSDRRRLKSMMEELQVPDGMAVILRTAGMERDSGEVKRDFDYLIGVWDDIREKALSATAPALIYEEANLIRRAIRDGYTRDVDDILVEGEAGYAAAKSYIRLLMPDRADMVQRYDNRTIPLFHRYQVESQIDNIHSSNVQLRSGGYIVINPTEALVSIDVNSGRATRERNIEETAYRTNLEAADEIARQLRLRDLAGLIVIDFIDMEENRNRHNVERRLKDALKQDRARIQVGRISAFGLLEMSRQRLRPSLAEIAMVPCPHCNGTGQLRSTDAMALQALRAMEEEGIRGRAGEVQVAVPTAVALYLLNHKRAAIGEIEKRHDIRVALRADDSLLPAAFKFEKLVPRGADTPRTAADDAEDAAPAASPERESESEPAAAEPAHARAEADDVAPEADADAAAPQAERAGRERRPESEEESERRRRRGRRGGRRRRRGRDREDRDFEPREPREDRESTLGPFGAEGENNEAGAAPAEAAPTNGDGDGPNVSDIPPELRPPEGAPERPADDTPPPSNTAAESQAAAPAERAPAPEREPTPEPSAPPRPEPEAVTPAAAPEKPAAPPAPAEPPPPAQPPRRGWWSLRR
jgi:ribonuclease E